MPKLDCPYHPEYKAIRMPKGDCFFCNRLYDLVKGLKEYEEMQKVKNEKWRKADGKTE